MEDVADNVPETTVEEVPIPTSKTLTDEEFINKDHDKESEEKEELETKAEEVKEEETEEDKEEIPLTAKGLVDKIKAENPKFFKTHPEARKMIFEASQYNELFSHPDEAKQVVENFQEFEKLSVDIMAGRVDRLLHTMDATNKGSIEKFAEGFPRALFNLNKQVFYEKVAEPVITSALKDALSAAAKSGNENLKRSVAHISQYLFDSPTIPERQQKQIDPRNQELEQKLHQSTVNQYNGMKEEVSGAAKRDIAKVILKDTPSDANAKMREAYAREVITELENQLMYDESHINRMNKLWDKIVDAEAFSNPRAKKDVYDAWMNRAKILLPGIEAKLRPEYFGKKVSGKALETKLPVGGSPQKSGTAKADPKDIDWSKTSDMDILNGTPKLRQRK